MAGNPNPSQADYVFAWSSEPETPTVGHFGPYGDPTYALWRKPITEDRWPFTVENCGYVAYRQGHWTRDGELMFCAGCGLDVT